MKQEHYSEIRIVLVHWSLRGHDWTPVSVSAILASISFWAIYWHPKGIHGKDLQRLGLDRDTSEATVTLSRPRHQGDCYVNVTPLKY